jgi:hypothetical protein
MADRSLNGTLEAVQGCSRLRCPLAGGATLMSPSEERVVDTPLDDRRARVAVPQSR